MLWFSYVLTSAGLTCNKVEVANARITDDKNTFNYGESATYECNLGYEFKDDVSNRVCVGDNVWSNPAPECEGKYVKTKFYFCIVKG